MWGEVEEEEEGSCSRSQWSSHSHTPHSQDPALSEVGMATLSTQSMDVFDFVGVVEVPAIVSVVDEHFYYYQHIYHPSVTGVTRFLTATLLRSALFTTVCVVTRGAVVV